MSVLSIASSLIVLYILHALSNCGRAQDFSTEIIHRESPLSDPTSTPSSRSGAAVHRSATPANSSGANNSRLLAARDSNLIFLNGFAVNGRLALKLEMGTPNQSGYVIVSTTVSLSWVMCHPCETCGKSRDGHFNSSASSTYKTVPCESKSCESIRSVPCTDSRDNCTYEQPYKKGLNASGLLSQDTLHLHRGIYDDVMLLNVLFGCTHEIIGKKPKDKTHQIFGRKTKDEISTVGYTSFAFTELSLINQIFDTNEIPSIFSFCIPLKNKAMSRIFFGNTPRADGTITTAKLFIKPESGLYYLQLMMIDVSFPGFDDTSPLKIAVEQEKAPPLTRIDGNMIIDSATQGTFIDDEKMEILIMKILTRFPRTRVEVPKNLRNILDLCFDWSEPSMNLLPIISFFFSDSGILYSREAFLDLGNGVLCLLIASTNHSKGVQILGGGLLRGNRVELDLKKKLAYIEENHNGECWDR